MERRCDHVFDCSDGSDEDQCKPLEIDEESYKKTFPPFLRSHKTEVRIELKIDAISKIDELTNTFKADVKLTLKWVDNRIIFNNLEKMETSWTGFGKIRFGYHLCILETLKKECPS